MEHRVVVRGSQCAAIAGVGVGVGAGVEGGVEGGDGARAVARLEPGEEVRGRVVARVPPVRGARAPVRRREVRAEADPVCRSIGRSVDGGAGTVSKDAGRKDGGRRGGHAPAMPSTRPEGQVPRALCWKQWTASCVSTPRISSRARAGEAEEAEATTWVRERWICFAVCVPVVYATPGKARRMRSTERTLRRAAAGGSARRGE